jgi:hypothetical protein
MNNIPKNWKLVEDYDGNFIYENIGAEFQISIDFTEQLQPPYSIYFNQLQGTFTKIGIEDGAYSTHAFSETEALQKAVEMMEFINRRAAPAQSV